MQASQIHTQYHSGCTKKYVAYFHSHTAQQVDITQRERSCWMIQHEQQSYENPNGTTEADEEKKRQMQMKKKETKKRPAVIVDFDAVELE